MRASAPRLPAFLLLLPLLACRGVASPPPTPPPAGVDVESARDAGSPEAREGVYRRAAELRGRALAAIDATDWRLAIEALRELERILPDNVLAPLDLAVCHRQLGQPEAALAAARRARALAPDNPRLLYALASIHHDAGDDAARDDVLDAYVAAHPFDPRPHYLRARWLDQEGEREGAFAAAAAAVERDPENLVLLVDRLVTAAGAGRLSATEEALDAVEDRLGGFEAPLPEIASDLRRRLDRGATDALSPLAQMVRNVVRPLGLYRQHLIPLVGGGSAGNGFFVQLDFDPPLPKWIQGGQDIEISFVDRTGPSGLDFAPVGPLALDPGDESDALLAPTAAGTVRLDWTPAGWSERIVEPLDPAERVWSRLDIDQDGRADRLVESQGRLRLESAAADALVAELEGPLEGVFPVDVDHDGDLDLVFAGASGARYRQNDGAGSWSERGERLGELAGGRVADLASADFDDDGDLDLAALADGRLRLLTNERLTRLEDRSSAWGLDGVASTDARLEVEDFDGDGLFDLLVWSPGAVRLLRNEGDRFALGELPATSGWTAAAAADFDNDGDRDVVAATADGAALLLRNRRGEFAIEPLGLAETGTVAQLLAGDFDGDGDLDLAARTGGSAAYWRNEGGSLNHWLRVRLRGKNENNSKNNSQGLFVKIESRVGDGYQAIVGNGGVNHLGLGAARQVDVLRVVWTNGLSQSWAALAAGQTLDEEQVLKGSCPFLYTWNGERFEFVTDLMWKSPLGMILADGSPAPHQSARDFVLVPGESLRPAGGELWLQVTEELWEAVYVDRQQLLAIDHPADVELVVDEKVTPPPYPRLPQLHWIARRLEPTGARGPGGRDVLERLRRRDGVYVSDLPLGRYQGTAAEHHLEIDFEGHPGGPAKLLLWGWIFPTDTSINVALSQAPAPPPLPPRLALREADGGWRPLAESIGFPAGKRKAVVVDLGDTLAPGAVTLRLTTSMQIYWDAAALALGEPAVEPTVTPLEPASAHLHYRGFSRLERVDDASPHLYDYAEVAAEPRFRDLAGRYTRYGPVGELLAATDDRYVVMNAGDELTVRYSAAALPELPRGWRRDYVLHTDGWVKDGDVNTTRSQTVGPLPYHGMRAYPDPEHRFPDTPSHRRWLRDYQTRSIDDLEFRTRLRRDSRR